MIECNGLSVKSILRDISFKLNEGELTVILGKNGSGKTTLFRTLSGNMPFSGEIRINGKDITLYSTKERSGLIAVMPQNLPVPDITLKRLVSFGRQPYTGFSGRLSEDDNTAVDSAIEAVGLTDIVHRHLPLLSGGERRLSYFAMMLAQSTPILLCDEPTASLDTEHQKKILRLLTEQRSNGKTILCILHDVNQAIEIADRVLVLDKGRLIYDGIEPFELPASHFGLTEYICGDKKLYL